MSILLTILGAVLLLAMNAFFVAAEFSAVSARRSLLETQAPSNLLARLALEIKRKLNLYLSSCQLGVTVASLGLGALTGPIVAALIRKPLLWAGMPAADMRPVGYVVALAIITALHITVGEQAPKSWAILYGDRLLPLLAGPLIVFTYVLYPAIWALSAASGGLLRLIGIKADLRSHVGLPHTEEELRGLLAQAVARGTIGKEQQQILTSAFDFPQLKVRQIMTPRPQVDYLLLDWPIGQVLRTVQNSAFTRLPLCDGDIDHVVGMVHMKDLFNHLQLIPGRLRFTSEKTPAGEPVAMPDGLPGSAMHVIGSGDIDLRNIKRDLLHVPELMSVPQLLRQFQLSRTHMAIVVDEYGATSGIATLEDVLEELVGEIEDEFDTAAQEAFLKEGDAFRVNGLFPIHEVRERLGLTDLDTGDADTIGGYVIQRLGRWPRIGDAVDLGEYSIRVLSVLQKRVGQVLITPRRPAAKSPQ